MDAAALPEIVETKETLRGVRKTFRCRLVESAPGEAVVLFVSDAPIAVGALTLPEGTITFGYFWEARPYNVYHWLTPAGRTVGHYFNVSDDTRISQGTLSWRDLVVDVLALPDGSVTVLDRDELPSDCDPALSDRIARATDAVVADAPAVIAALEARSRTLFSRLFGGQP